MKNSSIMFLSHQPSANKYKLAILSIALLLVSGCSDNEQPATQIVAKVNDEEISVHQLNNALAKTPSITPENIAAVRAELLEKLINEQLTVQQALAHKLDRSSDVMMEIEAARREILTRAYLKQVVATLPKPSAEEAKKFYDAHPELFAQRRIYNLQQINLPNPHPPLDDVRALTVDKTMQDIVIALKEKDIAFNAGSVTRSAEQIALTTLSDIVKNPEGELSILESPQGISIIKVESSQLAPLGEDATLQRIPQYLSNEQAKLAINDKLNLLKTTSEIVYMNEFANNKPPSILPPSATATTKPTQQTVNIEKGIAGI